MVPWVCARKARFRDCLGYVLVASVLDQVGLTKVKCENDLKIFFLSKKGGWGEVIDIYIKIRLTSVAEIFELSSAYHCVSEKEIFRLKVSVLPGMFTRWAHLINLRLWSDKFETRNGGHVYKGVCLYHFGLTVAKRLGLKSHLNVLSHADPQGVELGALPPRLTSPLPQEYWDPYGLDASLSEHVAPAGDLVACVWALPLESGEVEMSPVPKQLLEVVGALPSAAVFTPPASFIPQDTTSAGRNFINGLPDVWGELDAIDYLICMSTLQREGVEVSEAGRAVKVQADTPHLVSMGGGRLSTAVTLHPLPQGRVTLGSSPLSDVVVQGTGVEPSHCYIENHHGVVVLHPVLGPTTLDGLLVSTPVRLTQGCMLCIGRSNYLRFNHPAEAQLMRTILPNTRISMMPLSLYNGDSADGRSQPLEKKPPVAPRKSPRDSWGEVSTSSGSEDCCLLGKPSRVQVPVARLLSPKVFPPGSATVNSPASAVLGPSGLKNVPTATNVPTYQNVLFTNGSAVRSRSATPTNTYVNLSPTHSVMIGPPGRSQSTTPTPFKSPNYRAPVGVSRSVTSSPAFGTSHCGNAGSTPSLNEGPIYQRSHSTPSPAFNRNPGGLRSVTPSPPKSGGVASLSVNHRRTLSAGHDLSRDVVSPTPSFGSNCSLEELAARKDELEHKRKQAQQERMREQEAEKQERARLEEIVAMCAEYERQNKPPSTPTIHQNRIKTNGSLPRDKRLGSPGALMADGETSLDIFTFDTNNTSGCSLTEPSVSSPNTNTLTTPVSSQSEVSMGCSPYENVVVTSPGCVFYPQSPRTRIKTILSSGSKEAVQRETLDFASSNDYDFITLHPPQKQSESTSSVSRQSEHVAPESSFSPVRRSSDRDKFILPLGNKTADPSGGPDRGASSKLADGLQTRQRNSEDIMNWEHYNRRKVSVDEIDQLRKERGKLMAAMSGLKRKLADIGQQEEELLRELDMERALLDGEWSAQSEKLTQEEDRLSVLRARVSQLDQDMERSRTRDLHRQAECKKRLHGAEEQINRLEKEIDECSDPDWQQGLTERLRHQFELFEAERKLFEDLEFGQLEEEADLLAGREELQREVTELSTRVQCRQLRLRELETQRTDTALAAQQEGREMERALIEYLRRLEEGRGRLRIIEARLEEMVGQSIISGQDSSPDDGEELSLLQRARQSSKQSQDDLDRISRVTSGAPMEVRMGSLGRKTLESLKEIERNRHLHLAQQGSQVIEEERKRVQELKQRVQDEVKAQWEERRQREANCTSFNSDESSLTSSDHPTESASSDDALEKQSAVPGTSDIGGNDNEVEDQTPSQQLETMRDKELTDERDEETRPLSDGSAYEQQLDVRMRSKVDKKQRPLTRYLPIRSESLNLRAHIESAGHQVELCPHVLLDSTSCRGFLHKMGSKFHHWNKRWFVFDRSKRMLVYYADRMEKKARGGAYFQAIEEVYVDHLNSVKSPNPQLTFVMKTNERTFHLMAPSPEAMRIWVDVVFTGAEGYQEFEHGS